MSDHLDPKLDTGREFEKRCVTGFTFRYRVVRFVDGADVPHWRVRLWDQARDKWSQVPGTVEFDTEAKAVAVADTHACRQRALLRLERESREVVL